MEVKADDDFFGAQEGEEVEREERARELNKLERLHIATGFRDTADKAREAFLQGGFDDGFKQGAAAAAPAGFWLGVAAVTEAYRMQENQPSSEIRRVRMDLRAGLRGLQLDSTVDVTEAERICRELASEDLKCEYFGEDAAGGLGASDGEGESTEPTDEPLEDA